MIIDILIYHKLSNNKNSIYLLTNLLSGNGITLDDGSAGECGAFYVKEGSCNLVSAATAGYNNATSTSLVACQSPCFINYYVRLA